jgi:hypothetical protein
LGKFITHKKNLPDIFLIRKHHSSCYLENVWRCILLPRASNPAWAIPGPVR